MSDFANPCGGKRWRVLPSGLIEVEGEGFPTAAPGSDREKNMLATWENWGSLLQAAASRYELPVSWLLAVATMETGHLSHSGATLTPEKQARAISPADAIGVMQIMPFNAKPFGLSSETELFEPAKNIDVGAHILQKGNEDPKAGGLPGISAKYNSGRLCTSDPNRNEWMLLADANYPRRVIEWNNAAIQSGLTSSLSPSTLALLGAAVGMAAAITVAGLR